METFQIFAAVYSEKSPQGNGGLMTCTLTIQNIANTCGVNYAMIQSSGNGKNNCSLLLLGTLIKITNQKAGALRWTDQTQLY